MMVTCHNPDSSCKRINCTQLCVSLKVIPSMRDLLQNDDLKTVRLWLAWSWDRFILIGHEQSFGPAGRRHGICTASLGVLKLSWWSCGFRQVHEVWHLGEKEGRHLQFKSFAWNIWTCFMLTKRQTQSVWPWHDVLHQCTQPCDNSANMV